MKNIQTLERHNLIEINSNPHARCQGFVVILRNGERAPFSPSKITQTILKAGQSSGEFEKEIAEILTSQVIGTLVHYGEKTFGIEFIQDVIESILMRSPYKKTAKAHILYREQRAFIRKMSSQNKYDLIDRYLQRKDSQTTKQMSASYSLQGLNNYVVSEISQLYWLDKIYPTEVKEAHVSGALHIHDLGNVSVYCVGWDLQELLRVGFCGAYGKITSSPAKHFRSALGQMVNFFYTLQSEAAGALTFANVDTILAPFVRYDNLNYKAVKQAMQEFIFNVNVPLQAGFQAPFTNMCFDIHPPNNLKEKHVLIGGKPQKEKYGDFQKEMDMINEAFCEVLLEGDDTKRSFSFPIPTYRITKDFNWNKPALEKLWKMTAKYGNPYFVNCLNSLVQNDATMCCRLITDTNEVKQHKGGIFTPHSLTGSIGMVTINLPRIGLLAQNNLDFLSRLNKVMDIAKITLDIKRKTIEQFTNDNLYPFSKFYLQNVKKNCGQYWCNHFSTIGFIGLNEACINLTGKNLETKEGNDVAEQIMNFMNKKVQYYKEDTGNLYNVEAAPSANAAHKFAQLDSENFAEIFKHSAHKSSRRIYTNSSWLQTNNTNVFETLDSQNNIKYQYTGSTVLQIASNEETLDTSSVKNLIKKVFTDYKLPQITITPQFSICENHGYISGKQIKCPTCNKQTENYSRAID